MNKMILIIILTLLLCISTASANSSEKVDIVVLGMINHGPMQSTVNAIKEVISEYGNAVNVKWLDLESAKGSQYAEKQGLDAHLNVTINGKYKYKVNGKEVTFQWFEGQQWTKEDLNAVIFDVINNKEKAILVDSSKENINSNDYPSYFMAAGILAAIAVFAWFLTRKLRK